MYGMNGVIWRKMAYLQSFNGYRVLSKVVLWCSIPLDQNGDKQVDSLMNKQIWINC